MSVQIFPDMLGSAGVILTIPSQIPDVGWYYKPSEARLIIGPPWETHSTLK